MSEESMHSISFTNTSAISLAQITRQPPASVTLLSSSTKRTLVDAFDYTDHYIGSEMSRYDGNVYLNCSRKH